MIIPDESTVESIIPGRAEGPVVACEEGLSFWGGVDPATGRVIDAHHPLHDRSLTGAVVAMPTSRGSCTGSGVLLELALNGHAPAALAFREGEDVLTLGAMIAGRLFGRPIPVLRLDPKAYAALIRAERARLTDEHLEAGRYVCRSHGSRSGGSTCRGRTVPY
jgi:predicted aconitase with swiveling domain